MIPPLYKFRPVDDYTLESLREGYLYFSNPTTFNDPFEFRVYLSHETTPQVMKGKLLEVLEQGNPDLSESEKDYLAEELLRDGDISKQMEDFRYFEPEHNRQVSVFCMTSKRDVILQWSHYAKNHSGICIELDPNIDDLLSKVREVNYQDEYPSVDMLNAIDPEFVKKQVLTKFTAWGYEFEFRAMTLSPEGFYKHFTAPSVFRSITFGAKISDEDRERVIEATRARLSHIKFEQARLGNRTYSVEFQDYQVAP